LVFYDATKIYSTSITSGYSLIIDWCTIHKDLCDIASTNSSKHMQSVNWKDKDHKPISPYMLKNFITYNSSKSDLICHDKGLEMVNCMDKSIFSDRQLKIADHPLQYWKKLQKQDSNIDSGFRKIGSSKITCLYRNYCHSTSLYKYLHKYQKF
jgi:hypothetical protein